ncbi:YfhO family protein [Vagococcus coleopterorum]|uniref:YfhO family protein n=1 Tax=Vagococcus coleopterorum TaxID=2714946 RepID=A0A6G8AL45_9ENTE|nr:YfhO family protein [Vagococcus coleopterorum]QIL45682.1 YfhO family protein [Vagococcus coleopterorum]
MKEKLKRVLKTPYPYLAFFIPVIIMAIKYATLGIYWGSDRTLLASDAFSQFSNFHASFNNVLKGDQSIFYTWNSSLGLNYWALIAYYLGGIFTPLVFFFKNNQIPDVIYLLTLLKIGLAGLSFWVFSKRTYKLQSFTHVALAVSYALMSYVTVHAELIMWLDAFIYLPLVFLGLQRLMEEKKPLLLFISYFLLFVSNFYFGFMIGVLSFLYYFAKTIGQWERYKKTIPHYLITSLLAGGASMVMILPTVFDLQANGEGLNPLLMKKTEATGLFDFFIKNMIGVYDTTKYGSIPFIYIGLIPLVFCLFYFLSNRFPLKQKLLYGGIFAFITASFYFEPLNLFWHGFHFPNMFLFRYSFAFSFLVIVLAGYGMEAFTKKEAPKLIALSLSLMGIFAIVFAFNHTGQYEYLKWQNLAFTLIFLVLYLAGLLYYLRIRNVFGKVAPVYMRRFAFVLLLLMSLEASVNTHFILNGVKKDWNYPSRSLYSGPYKDYKEAVDHSKKEDNDFFYRMESLDSVSANDSINYGYHGLSQFSSIRNTNSAQLLNKLGFRSRGANANTRYENNTLMMDSLFGIKYNLSKNPPQKDGFTESYRNDTYKVNKNEHALGLGVLAPNSLADLTLKDNNVLGNQTDFINSLTGKTDLFYTQSTPKVVESNNVEQQKNDKGNIITYQEKEGNIGKKITFSVTVPAGRQAYLRLQPTDFNQIKSSTAEVSINGLRHKTQLKNNGEFYNLGNYLVATEITFTLELYGTPAVSLFEPTVIFLNLDNYHSAMKQLAEKRVDFTVTGRKATAEVNLEKDQLLMTTIPYDKGWTAYVDGKKTKTTDLDDALLTLPLKAGSHQIKLVFLPQGFLIGFSLFIICFILFSLYLYILRKQKNKP